jgi:hypothetical protein
MNILTSNDFELIDLLPPFINQFPDKQSDKINIISASMTNNDVRRMDNNVREVVTHLRKDVVLMIGARQTHITPTVGFQRSTYLRNMCGKVDLICLSQNCYGFILWWPDPSGRRHASNAAKKLLDSVLKMEGILLKLLCHRLDQEHPRAVGIPLELALEIQNWYEGLPMTAHLQQMLVRLGVIWSSANLLPEGDLAFNLNVETRPSELSTTRSHSLSRIVQETLVQQDLATTRSFADLTQGWSKAQETRIMMETKSINPDYDILTETEQVMAVEATLQRFVFRMRQSWIERKATSGEFQVVSNETQDQQWTRFWAEVNLKRLQRAYHENAELVTCCYCGQVIRKAIQPGGKLNVRTRNPDCVNGVVHRLGWSLARGDLSHFFPAGNLFRQFLETLAVNTAINDYQLAAAFLHYCHENEWHPQVQLLLAEYGDISADLRNFRKTKNRNLASAFKNGLENVIGKLSAEYGIVKTNRGTVLEERRRFKAARGIAYVFRALDGQDAFLEDLNFQDYRLILSIPFTTVAIVHRIAH